MIRELIEERMSDDPSVLGRRWDAWGRATTSARRTAAFPVAPPAPAARPVTWAEGLAPRPDRPSWTAISRLRAVALRLARIPPMRDYPHHRLLPRLVLGRYNGDNGDDSSWSPRLLSSPLLLICEGPIMPQAVVDPDDLRQFALKLRKFNVDLRERLSSLTNDMSALSETWRDQEHKRFAEQFDEHLKLMARFLELSDRHVPYLVRKADQIDEYLQS